MRFLVVCALAASLLASGWLPFLLAQDAAAGPEMLPAAQPLADPPPPSDPPPPTDLDDPPPPSTPLQQPAAPDFFSPDQQVPAGTDPQEVEPLARGPLHEAFAEQVNMNPAPSPVVARQPPEPINEIPPEVKPEGDDVQWIPGYWAWDDERNDYIWVSGVWRKTPPGRRWIPGYWAAADGGHRWIAGTWAAADTTQLNVLPQPPESLEQGPNSIAQSADDVWIPGSWTYSGEQYYWQPGCWSQGYDDWIWVPQRYVWTPTGCIYASGYWDYPVTRRGFCYAPYYFARPVYRRVGYAFTPYVALNISRCFGHLFVNPFRRHYYFGNYYGAHHLARGYHPWHQYHRRHFEPLLAHYDARHRRHGASYVSHLGRWHDYHLRHAAARPSHSFAHLKHSIAGHHGGSGGIRDIRGHLPRVGVLPGRGGPSGGGHSDRLAGRGPGNSLGYHVRDLTQRVGAETRYAKLDLPQRTSIGSGRRQEARSLIDSRIAGSRNGGRGTSAASRITLPPAVNRVLGGAAPGRRDVTTRPGGPGGQRTQPAVGSARNRPGPGDVADRAGRITSGGRPADARSPSTAADVARRLAPGGVGTNQAQRRQNGPRGPTAGSPAAAIGGPLSGANDVSRLSTRREVPRAADRSAGPVASIQDRIRQAQQQAAAARASVTNRSSIATRRPGAVSGAIPGSDARAPISRSGGRAAGPSTSIQQRIQQFQQRAAAPAPTTGRARVDSRTPAAAPRAVVTSRAPVQRPATRSPAASNPILQRIQQLQQRATTPAPASGRARVESRAPASAPRAVVPSRTPVQRPATRSPAASNPILQRIQQAQQRAAQVRTRSVQRAPQPSRPAVAPRVAPQVTRRAAPAVRQPTRAPSVVQRRPAPAPRSVTRPSPARVLPSRPPVVNRAPRPSSASRSAPVRRSAPSRRPSFGGRRGR